jgi:hypothetical protein
MDAAHLKLPEGLPTLGRFFFTETLKKGWQPYPELRQF